MKFVFLMDPLSSVIFEKDTTFRLMLGAHDAGHEVFYLPKGGTSLKDQKICFQLTQVIPQLNPDQLFEIKDTANYSQDDIDVVFIRTDPPFDQDYLLSTWLLDKLPSHIPVINNPSGVRTANEKIWCTQFTDITPRTLISRNQGELLSFMKQEKEVVAKPTDGHGGKSIFHVKNGDKNANVILETMTNHWSKEIICQEYIKEATQGDKRILLLNGEPLGAVLRMHSEDDHRNNFFSGGKPQTCEITERDKKIIKTIKPKLGELSLYFVGIDILGDYLIEVNVTSPTCLQEMNDLYGLTLQEKIIKFTEELIDECRSAVRIHK